MLTEGTATQGNAQVLTRQQPFPEAKDRTVIYNEIIGERLVRPPEPSGRGSDDVWNFISRCWSPSLNDRPDANLAMNALNDVADAVEVGRKNVSGELYGRQSRAEIDATVDRRSSTKPRPLEASRRWCTDPENSSASIDFRHP